GRQEEAHRHQRNGHTTGTRTQPGILNTTQRITIMPLTWVETMERAKGIEPSCPAWKAGALPLSYARAPGRSPWMGHRVGTDSVPAVEPRRPTREGSIQTMLRPTVARRAGFCS